MTHRTLGEGWKHCVLHFAGAPAAFLYQEYTRESGFTFHMNASVNFHRQLLKLLNAYTEISPYREVQVSTLLTSLLLSIITTSDAYRHAQQAMPGQIKDIVYYINNNYSRDLSVEYLSNYFAISKYHLCRSFKKYTDYTLTEYITQLRMDRAKELLKTTALAANQIAAVVGITDENYLPTVQKARRHFGTQVPQELMKKTRVTDYGHTRFLSFQSRSMRLSRIPLKGARTEGI